MDKKDLELFKQALNEGVSNKFDKMATECTEEIVCSERHKLAMRTILYGKAAVKRAGTPGMKRIIAILIAAVLLLTSCGIIFRNEIREIFNEFFVSLMYEGAEDSELIIKEVYALGYVPEGYTLVEEKLTSIRVQYKFANKSSDILQFEQRSIKQTNYYINSESGYSEINEIEEYEVYFRLTDKYYHYIWNNEKYSMYIKSSVQLSNDELIRIIDGIATK